MRIVVIDDDVDYQEILSTQLEAEGFKVFCAQTGLEGLNLTRQCDPDLIILDVSMPYLNGWETCETLRSFSKVPVMMVSAVAKEEADEIRALRLGADSYLTKPIGYTLLKAHINALLRRSSEVKWQQHRLTYIDEYLQIDLYRQEVTVNLNYVSLSDLEFRLLELLVSHANEIVTSLEIMEALWGENGHQNKNHLDYVRIYIGRLRRHIEPDPTNPAYIINIHGMGYRFTSQI